MSGVEEFETLLKDVVQAKRLSASKMTKLTEIATKSLDHDTQLVSIIYRTHKSLPNSCKVSSLYVFDAVARAAKHQVSKQKEHAASFLSKLGGVVEGLYRDMQDPDIPEGKEKSKKVLDIWIAKGTFPADLLSRLGDILRGTEKAPEAHTPLSVGHVKNPEPEVMPPPMSPTHSQSPVPPATHPGVPMALAPAIAPAAPPDPQATLLALLAQAANAGSVVQPFPHPSVNTTGTQLAAAQYVLQQLGHAPAAPPAPNVAPPPIVSTHSDFNGHPNRSSRSPIADDARDPRRPFQSHREGSRQERYYSPPESGRAPYDSQSDRQPYARAPTRGNFRGRGFSGGDDRDRRRRDDSYGDRRDRDYPRDRDKHYNQRRDWSPPPARRRGGGGGRSRSRSPEPQSRYRERRRSPSPRRPAAWQPARPESISKVPSGKDEFGRDVRPASPLAEKGNEYQSNSAVTSPPTTNTSTSTPTSTTPASSFSAFGLSQHSSQTSSIDTAPGNPSTTSNPVVSNTHTTPATHDVSPHPNAMVTDPPMNAGNTNGMASLSSAQPNSTSTTTNASATGAGGETAGLDKFDFASFDFASPAAWEALGKMWQVTYGSLPAGEQLMAFVMSLGAIKPEVDSLGQGRGVTQQQQHQPGNALQQVQSWVGADQQDQPYADYGRGTTYGNATRGRGRGGAARGGSRGGYGAGRGRGGYYGYEDGQGYGEAWGNHEDHETDAIVLGGGDDPSPAAPNGHTPQYGLGGSKGRLSATGGTMQRVGDKWLFVES